LPAFEVHLTPENRMIRAIVGALERMLGWSETQVLNFHVDVRTAPACPGRYERELIAFFGPGSSVVMEGVREALCKESGRTLNPACKGIEGCLDCIRGTAVAGDQSSASVQLATCLRA